MTTALVTGGAGFLGSHLCDRLLKEGIEVVALDDLSTGSRDNIQHLFGRKDFRFVLHDVSNPYEVQADWVFNLACPASPIHYQRNPMKTVVTNVVGTLNALSLASRTGARFFQASTSEVYGDPDVHPQVEEYQGNVSCTGPRACYDEGKRCAETLTFDHHREAGVDVRVVRIFNTYGPRMAINDGRVVSNFIVQALRGEDITVYGEGRQTRSFCYVDDLIDGFLLMMKSDQIGPINIGNPGEFTIQELAQEVIRLTGSKSKLVDRPLPKDDPRQRCPDISKAKERLGFQPKVPLAAGLAPTIEYFRGALAKTALNRTS
ncbi:MAG: UDP-glucuronate decarboxylase [Myxococcaceae bacterium]|nr:UDP-glucuronate decarboxylase [Myxococcaceae bacterium]